MPLSSNNEEESVTQDKPVKTLNGVSRTSYLHDKKVEKRKNIGLAATAILACGVCTVLAMHNGNYSAPTSIPSNNITSNTSNNNSSTPSINTLNKKLQSEAAKSEKLHSLNYSKNNQTYSNDANNNSTPTSTNQIIPTIKTLHPNNNTSINTPSNSSSINHTITTGNKPTSTTHITTNNINDTDSIPLTKYIYDDDTNPGIDSSIKFSNPVKNNTVIIGQYGQDSHNKFHSGIDYDTSCGSYAYSIGKGKVIFAGTMSGYGQRIVVQYGSLYATYSYLSSINVEMNQTVENGQVLGETGKTDLGKCALHFEMGNSTLLFNPINALEHKNLGDQRTIAVNSIVDGIQYNNPKIVLHTPSNNSTTHTIIPSATQTTTKDNSSSTNTVNNTATSSNAPTEESSITHTPTAQSTSSSSTSTSTPSVKD